VTIELALLSRVSYREQEITRPRVRGLLALLAADLRTGCGTTRLVEALWPDARPENPAKALQVLVSQARAQLGTDLIVSTPVGYRLSLGEDQVDASAVLLSASASARQSRAGDHASALEHAETGLALWDGPASRDTELADPLSVLRSERAVTYRTLVRARALAQARLGRRPEAIETLTELIGERPRDEEILAELLRCEAATLGPSAALARYDGYRQALRDELGSDPGPELQRVYQQLLQGETPEVRHGVAHEPNPLLGRDDDIAAVTELLRTSRVTSIVGAGGLGKTRLAHVVSRRAEQRVVFFVGLVGVAGDGDVVNEVASALGVGESGRAADLLGGIVTALGPGSALLVLDNCEHVVHGAAELVRALVSLSEDLRVLTTSRASLGLSSESVYPLPELSLPTTVELFGQRARAVRPEVDLPADVVEELCGHLDGLPLAVELAAARIRVMSAAELAGRLGDRFSLLRGGSRDAPPRHQALHAVVDWSWNLLEPAGQTAMRALSVFPDGFTADAARQVLGDDEVLADLVDQSLLKVTATGPGTRFRMLETVREFSTARREEAGETERVLGRFLGWARDFGLAHHESVFGADVVVAAERIRAEQDNLVYALRHGVDRQDGATVAATAAALGSLWTVESNLTRVAALAKEIEWPLSHFRPGPAFVEATRTAAIVGVVNGYLIQGAPPARFLVLLRRLPAMPPGTLPRATEIVLRALSEDHAALHALCDSEEPLLAGMANGVASYVHERADDLESALKAAERMAKAVEDKGTPWMRVVARSRVAELLLQLDRATEALPHMRVALRGLEEIGAGPALVRVRWAMVLANLQCGDVDEAEHWLERSALGGGDETAGVLMFDVGVGAEILLARGDVEHGLGLWRRASDRIRVAESAEVLGLEPWAWEVQAVTVIAHAQHGRLDLVEEITGELPPTLSGMLAAARPSAFPICGALLLALAMVDLDRGASGSGARLIALAEAFRFVRGFQPTMSAARARLAAEKADKAAYDDAVSSYAGLDHDALRAAAMAALKER